MRYLSLCATLLLAAAACSKGDKDTDTVAVATTPAPAPAAAPVDERATNAARVASAMEANPAAADSILKAAGYTRDSFEALMYDIAADSASAAAYAAARSQ